MLWIVKFDLYPDKLSDLSAHLPPFGYGWNLLGTEDYRINMGVINARGLWYSSVGIIIVGHIIAVYLAHLISLRTV